MTNKQKKLRGRPVKNQAEPINASAKDIAKAIFKDADQRINKPK